MDTQIRTEQASLSPIELLKEGKDLIGDQYWLFFGITLVGMLIGGAVPIFLIGPMMVGIYLCFFQRQRQQPVEFGLLFKGFDYFVESLIATLIATGVALLVIVPTYILFFVVGAILVASLAESVGPVVVLIFVFFYLIEIIIMILVQLPFLFMYPLIAEHKMKGLDAVKASWSGVKKNFMPCCIMIIVFGFIYMVAALACIIPAYLFLPIAIGGLFVAYRRIFPADMAQKPIPTA